MLYASQHCMSSTVCTPRASLRSLGLAITTSSFPGTACHVSIPGRDRIIAPSTYLLMIHTCYIYLHLLPPPCPKTESQTRPAKQHSNEVTLVCTAENAESNVQPKSLLVHNALGNENARTITVNQSVESDSSRTKSHSWRVCFNKHRAVDLALAIVRVASRAKWPQFHTPVHQVIQIHVQHPARPISTCIKYPYHPTTLDSRFKGLGWTI